MFAGQDVHRFATVFGVLLGYECHVAKELFNGIGVFVGCRGGEDGIGRGTLVCFGIDRELQVFEGGFDRVCRIRNHCRFLYAVNFQKVTNLAILYMFRFREGFQQVRHVSESLFLRLFGIADIAVSGALFALAGMAEVFDGFAGSR